MMSFTNKLKDIELLIKCRLIYQRNFWKLKTLHSEVLSKQVHFTLRYLIFVTGAKSISFTVGVTSSSSDWSGDILVFPHIVTNNGNGYNLSTGKFTAPKDGAYVFFVAVNSYGSKIVYLNIVHNGLNIVQSMAYGSSASHQTGTNMAVVHVDKGDSVWVSRSSGTGYYTTAVPITTFSGFLLSWKQTFTK